MATTLNYLDIRTVIVSCGTCMDQFREYEFDKIFPGCRLLDIHEYLAEKGITLPETTESRYLYHDPCHTPMKVQNPLKVARQLMGQQVLLSDRCCGESGTLAVTRPDVSTQVRFRKEEELGKNTGLLREDGFTGQVKLLTSCPSCLQGLSRYEPDVNVQADYIVVELVRRLLGDNWLADYLSRAADGGIERILL
jgi:Fe-S oxidoreductase